MRARRACALPPAPPPSLAAPPCSCQTYEGGLGGLPGAEAHGAYTFLGVAALHLLDRLSAIDVPRVLVRIACTGPERAPKRADWVFGARRGCRGTRTGPPTAKCVWRAGFRAGPTSWWTAATRTGWLPSFRSSGRRSPPTSLVRSRERGPGHILSDTALHARIPCRHPASDTTLFHRGTVRGVRPPSRLVPL